VEGTDTIARIFHTRRNMASLTEQGGFCVLVHSRVIVFLKGGGSLTLRNVKGTKELESGFREGLDEVV
jgi:hypothetical protein